MSLTSTDGARPRTDSRFRRALTILIAGLVVACAVFAVLGQMQGPKLASAQVDVSAVTAQSGQQLRLFANQAVEPVTDAQVVVTPNTPVTVTTTGDVIVVQFDRLLDYGTRYTVRVADVRGASQASSTIEYEFTTEAPPVYSLDRGETVDEIVRTTIGGGARTVVYSAPRIQDFVPVGDALAVVSIEAGGTSALDLVDISSGVTERRMLPSAGVISQLQASTVGAAIGFLFTSSEGTPADRAVSDQLMTIDFALGSDLTPVTGLAGSPLAVTDWQFVPGGTSLVAHTRDQSVFLVDPLVASIVPLGQYPEIGKVAVDGSAVTVRDSAGLLLVSLPYGTESRIEPSPVDQQQAFVADVQLLPDGRHLEKIALPQPDGTFRVAVAVDDGEQGRVVYETENGAGSILGFSVSPNGQYAAIEVVPVFADAATDGYELEPRYTSTITVFVALESGAIAGSVEAISLRW